MNIFAQYVKPNLDFYSRYPNYVCSRCVEKAIDANGRPLKFYNQDMCGGFVAVYTDTNERRNSNTCYINGVECHASEAFTGGIVVEIVTGRNETRAELERPVR